MADDKMAEGNGTTKDKKTRQVKERHQKLGVGRSILANWTFGRNT